MIGCDGLLGSVVLEDKCRVCGGDGANCKTISGILDNSVSFSMNNFFMKKIRALYFFSGPSTGIQ